MTFFIFRVTCPWRVPPQPISDRNVGDRARMLLDQYRKKSQLYKTDVVLAPLGDDFRYDSAREWDLQYQNYKKIMDYINSTPELNAEVKFGTLEDYFSAMRADATAQSGGKKAEDFLPSKLPQCEITLGSVETQKSYSHFDNISWKQFTF